MLPTLFTRQDKDLFGGLSQLQNELDRFFNGPSFLRGSAPRSTALFENTWVPAVDVYETKENIRVKAELPGLKKDEVQVSVQDGILSLKGERKQETDEKQEGYRRVEMIYGQFHRAIQLPTSVDTAKIKANYKDGVLDIVLPKKEEAKPKTIDVEVK
jgi:HSP20 family protein